MRENRGVEGDPVHRRNLEIALGPESAGRREARGQIVDRRLQGHTYTGGRIVGPGPVHDMSARLVLDVRSGRVEAASGAMALPAFPGTATTRFEGCRDVLPNLAGLAGLAANGDLSAGIRAAIGRERGCYHLTTLVLAMAPLLRAALREPEPRDARFERAIELTACEAGSGQVRLHGLLVERRGAGEPRRARLAWGVDPGEMKLRRVVAEAAPELAPAPEVATALEGVPLFGGFARTALERLEPLAGAEELLELALGLNAVVTQALVTVPSAQDPRLGEGRNRAHGTCYMWRAGGALESMPSGKLPGPRT
jgi:hypothetical protein